MIEREQRIDARAVRARLRRAGVLGNGLRMPPVIWALIALNVLIEAMLTGADLRVWGAPFWRSWAYQNGAFWSGLLRDWVPNYTGQPVTMFASYSVLHAGPGHLLGNMVVLGLIGRSIWLRLGTARFLAVYGAAVLGGAAVFGVLTNVPAPMVGASGGIFGLAGAAMAQYWTERRSIRGLLGALVLFVVLNVVTWALADGQMAWQTHLGGFLAGALLALFFQGRGDQASVA